MVKLCTVCHEKRDLSDFNKKSNSPDGRQNICRDCSKARSRAYYAANQEYHSKYVRCQKKTYIGRTKCYLDAVKEMNGCQLCPEREAICLDFHHMNEDEKEFLISQLRGGKKTSMKVIISELKKCACVCSNCHRKLHAGLLELPLDVRCKLPPIDDARFALENFPTPEIDMSGTPQDR